MDGWVGDNEPVEPEVVLVGLPVVVVLLTKLVGRTVGILLPTPVIVRVWLTLVFVVGSVGVTVTAVEFTKECVLVVMAVSEVTGPTVDSVVGTMIGEVVSAVVETMVGTVVEIVVSAVVETVVVGTTTGGVVEATQPVVGAQVPEGPQVSDGPQPPEGPHSDDGPQPAGRLAEGPQPFGPQAELPGMPLTAAMFVIVGLMDDY